MGCCRLDVLGMKSVGWKSVGRERMGNDQKPETKFQGMSRYPKAKIRGRQGEDFARI